MYWRTLIEDEHGELKYSDVDKGRDYTLGHDPNKIEFQNIAKDILKIFNIPETSDNMERFKNSKLADLTEYGRVVHAEMEALATCARNAISCRGAEIYVTTYPCHNCAKHIIAAGIKKVYYIEPYPKSKASEFYGDSISSDPKEKSNKVLFLPFFGVGPTRFVNMFSMKYGTLSDRKRKDGNGIIIEREKGSAEMRDQLLPTSYLDRETICALNYGEIIKELDEIREEKKHGQRINTGK